MPFAIVMGQAVTELPKDLYIPPQALEVILEAFEGPLDLLLYLIRRQNLDILDIDVSAITEQYMQYVELMDAMQFELAAEYLLMAAMLAEIKSRMLLPRSQELEEDEEDPRASLIRRLQEYERFKQAAEDMDVLPRLERDTWVAKIQPPDLKKDRPLPEIEMRELLVAFGEVLRRADMYESHQIQRESLSTREPLSLQRISQLFDEFDRPGNDDLKQALADVAARCEDRGYELVQVASGYRFQVRQNLSTWVGRIWQERPPRYSRALLETLSLIAYRQPITRGEIEEIRGVAVSTNIIRTLQEREWVRVVGHRDVPGKPAMYATTRQFLDYFNLKSLEQLPPLADIKELDNLSGNLEFDSESANDAVNDREDAEAASPPSTTASDTADHADEASTEEATVGDESKEQRQVEASP
ncbi:MAG: SMC-Scp complex subunit ScpB [Cellvibrionales bacterium]|nr:SMC-Scp complex subunit ScpB [Cellvibrionales bacterium]